MLSTVVGISDTKLVKASTLWETSALKKKGCEDLGAHERISTYRTEIGCLESLMVEGRIGN